MKKLILMTAIMALAAGTMALGGWNIETVDVSTGKITSLALDANGYTHIAYQRSSGLKYAYWDGSSWQIMPVVDVDGSDWGCSIVLDEFDHPHIAYCAVVSHPTYSLKYAYHNGTSWDITTIHTAEAGVYTGQNCDIAIDSDGYCHISYYGPHQTTSYAYQDATGWHHEQVASSSYRSSSIALQEDGGSVIPHISYRTTGSKLNYAYKDGTGWHVEQVGSDALKSDCQTSIALDASNVVHIAYYNDGPQCLSYAHGTTGSWTTEIVDNSDRLGERPSLALDLSGHPHISYWDRGATYGLKYAHYDGSGWQIQRVADESHYQGWSSIAMDAFDYPHIAYSKFQGPLKYAVLPAPTEVWVDDDYTAGSCDGHIWGYDAFDNIQDGIDAVAGSIVHVAAGTYNEVVTISKADLVVQSIDGSASTIIDAGGAATVVNINVDNVTFSGFTLQNASGVNVRGIDMAGPISGCNISDIIIQSLTTTSDIYALLAVQVNASTFSNLFITNLTHGGGGGGGAYGIGLNTSDNNTFTNSTIGNFTSDADAQGVLLNNNCDGNTFTTTAINALTSTTGCPCGVTIWERNSEPSSNNNTFTATTISNLIGASSVYGIQNRANAGYEHVGNKFYNTNISGLDLSPAATFVCGIYNEYAQNSEFHDTYISGLDSPNEVAIGINSNVGPGLVISGGEIQDLSGVVWYKGVGINILGSTSTASIEEMAISATDVGISISSSVADVSQVSINYNSIAGNIDYGLRNDHTETVDAGGNWWGDASGPNTSKMILSSSNDEADPASLTGGESSELNSRDTYRGEEAVKISKEMTTLSVAIALAGGTGDALYGSVDYTPWLDVGTDTEPSTPGFQGDLSVLNVDDDSPQTGTTGRIQEGVDMVTGSTVNVFAGTYEAQVVIGKELTLLGADKNTTIIQSPITLTEYFTTSANNYPIVYIHDANVTIEDFTIDGLGRGNANYRFNGIGFWNAGGSVTNVHLTGVRDTPFSGTQHGVAIYAYNSTGGPYTINLSGVAIDDFQKNGTALSGNGLTANFSNCTVIGHGLTNVTAQNGIQIGFGAGGTVTDCSVSDIAYDDTTWAASGILFYQATSVDVSGSCSVTNSQSGIVFHETNGSVDGATVSASDANNKEEGISVREYGETKASGSGLSIAAASPLSEEWQYKRGQSGTATTVALSNLNLTGANQELSYGIGVWAIGDDVNVTVNKSAIQDWGVGVVAKDSVGDVTVLADSNTISGNDFGVWTNSASAQDFENNNWGASDGPEDLDGTTEVSIGQCYSVDSMKNTVAEFFPGEGLGNGVTDNIDYCPWIPWSCCNHDGIRGDVNYDVEGPNIADLTYLVDYLFRSGPEPICFYEGDVNGDGNINIADITYLVDYLFRSGPPPPPCP